MRKVKLFLFTLKNFDLHCIVNYMIDRNDLNNSTK